MNEPTEEQIKKFWEWCGWKRIPLGKHNFHYERGEKVMDWLAPDSDRSSTRLPDIDLNNLFKYAVPKVLATGHWLGMITTQLSSGTQYTFVIYVEKYRDKAEHEASDRDPALALFWAIYKVMEEK